MKNLENLTDKELKSFFCTEDTEDLSNDGIIGEVKRYILSGKKDFTMSKKINEIEILLIRIAIKRWIKLI